jgi:rhodanese-related sulfurtransferase
MAKIIPWLTVLGLLFNTGFTGEGESCTWNKSGKVDLKSHEIKTGENKVKYEKQFPLISRTELEKAIRDKSVVLIDANSAKTYAAGHIPGALNYTNAGKSFASLLPADKKAFFVAYCGEPGCQAWCKAADELNRLGYKNVKHYKGGLKEWKAAGLAIEKPKKNKKS